MSAKPSKKPRSIGKYNIFETLGKGGYSWVKKGEDTETGAVVALKFMNRATDQWALEQAEQVRTEIKSLTQVRHDYVMKLYAYNLSAKYPLNDGTHIKTILLVLEYCPGGELFDILYYADKLEEITARTYFQQMMKGLEAVHKAGIAHRDLKPQNLLLDVNFCLKITDFGLSKIMETEQDRIMKTTYVGTRGYQAPELLKNQKYTNACDIFSMGVVLFILLAGYPPFEAAHKTDKWYKPIAQGDYEKFWHVHRGAKISDDAKDLINKMLHYRASKRCKLKDILEHKWFVGKILKDEELKDKIIARFAQARENRKKDAKKVKDLIESEHNAPVKRKVVEYTETLLNTPAPLVPLGVKLRSMTTFLTEHKPYQAIWAINTVLVSELGAKTEYKPEEDCMKIKCTFKPVVAKDAKKDSDDAKDDADDKSNLYEFVVQAYRDPDFFGTLIHLQPTHAPNRLTWSKVYRDILGAINNYDILLDGVPAIAHNVAVQKSDQPKQMDPAIQAMAKKELDAEAAQAPAAVV